ncbi:MAG TPA: sulfatase [Opitutus sp.]|nr:sulfatase [Opitutus sp.]
MKFAVALPFLLAAVALAAPRRPNIVFIFADDHAWQALSAYGDSRHLVATPNIDRIAHTGMRFDRCLVTNSLCGPSRATVLTGKYSHLNGFRDNAAGARFDGSQVTFPKLLQAAGYQTAVIGKWHLGSDPTGFDFWQILPGQGIYYNPPMIRNGAPIQPAGYVTDIITDATLDWLDHRDPSRPFLLMCQHKAPHRHWEPPLRELAADGDRTYPEPPTLFDDYAGRGIAEHDQDMMIAVTGKMGMNDYDLKLLPMNDLDPAQRKVWDAYYEPRNAAFRAAHLAGRDLVRWKYQRYLHDYLACVRGIDDSVGRVLDYLERHGLADNTIVVYSSDQGFFLGEHGWFDKRWIFEESLRTPLLVRWPGVTRPGSVNRDLVSNLDFAETFLDAAGVPVPAGMQGRSLAPLLAGRRPADWRTSFYYHYYEYPDPHHVRPHYGVVTDRYKLVHFYGAGDDYDELFDLEKDPHELRSVYDDRGYAEVRTRLTHELARLRREVREPDAGASPP